jgi:hypothetical protein
MTDLFIKVAFRIGLLYFGAALLGVFLDAYFSGFVDGLASLLKPGLNGLIPYLMDYATAILAYQTMQFVIFLRLARFVLSH